MASLAGAKSIHIASPDLLQPDGQLLCSYDLNGALVAIEANSNPHPAARRTKSRSAGAVSLAEKLKQLNRLNAANYTSLSEMFGEFLRTGCEILGLPAGMLLHMDGNSKAILALSGSPAVFALDARLVKAANRLANHPLSGKDLPDEPDLKFCLAAPILAGTDLFGMLMFSSHGQAAGHVFSPEQWDLTGLMASGMARFIVEDRLSNERSLRALREKHRDQILEMVFTNQPPQETLRYLTAWVESHLPGTACAILLWKQGLLLVESAPNLPEAFRDLVAEERISLAVPAVPDLANRFSFLKDLGFELSSTAAITSVTGAAVGTILLLHPAGKPPTVPVEKTLRVACRLAGNAIEQRLLVDRLALQAQSDFLTGLPNHFHLMELLETCITNAPVEGGGFAVLFADLDRFQQINDTLGHQVGDRILTEVAGRLRATLPSAGDFAARMGGDEFAVVLHGLEGVQAVAQAARRFLDALRLPYRIDGRELFVTASIGFSRFPVDGKDAVTLVRRASSAMSLAKKDGKNAVECFAADSQNGGIERLELETALRRALEKSEFELYFQPIFSMDGGLEGLEALLVWNHATRGRVPASEFIPLAEETGLIIPIGAWVLNEACRLGTLWRKNGWAVKRIAVNMSALQFSGPDFLETVAGALAASGYPAELLELELTESSVLRDIAGSIQRMTRLRELGVRIAIDDFGTGYSSLNYLRSLPVSSLKIDQTFLRDLTAHSTTLTVVKAIVSLAHQMGLTVVAEGVETAGELELLRDAGCDCVQGHLFCPSIRVDQVEKLLADPKQRATKRLRSKGRASGAH